MSPEITCETACLILQLFNPLRTLWRNCVMSEAPDNETDAAPQTGSCNIPHLTPALLHLVCVRRVTMRSDEGSSLRYAPDSMDCKQVVARRAFRPASRVRQ